MTSSHASPDALPTFDDVCAAAERLAGVTVRTPLLESPLLNQHMGRRLLVKPECLQVTGSFKFRGASNKIRGLSETARDGDVVAFSNGNHAQGVAAAAHYAGIPALIVMPDDAPAIKRANTEAWGAEVRVYNRYTEDRAQIAAEIADDRGATLIRPFDDPFIIGGQGTVGLEIAEDLDSLGIKPDAVVVPCGGGGLVSGTALALTARRPGIKVYAVEPEHFDDTARSFSTGEIRQIADDAHSICDALLSPSPGVVTFALNRQLLAGVLLVSDAEAKAAMARAFLDLKIVAEPGGAVALASVLHGKLPPGDGPVVVVVSGGNVDPALFRKALA